MADTAAGGSGLDSLVGARLRALRRGKGLAAKDVAARAGVSPGYLSRLENGHISPTVSTLTRVVQAMGESIVNVFGEAEAGPVVRRDDRILIRNRGADDYLVTPTRTGKLEVLETVVEPGGSSGAQHYTHAGDEECIVILDGWLRVWLDGVQHDLNVGDSITFPCGVPHRWSNPGDVPARAHWIITPAGY